MTKLLGHIFLIFYVLNSCCLCLDELLSVVVIFRHGNRTIVRPYPTDPYGNSSFWPDGFGQLTNQGKIYQMELGEWLRNRYSKFLPLQYSEKDIHVQSTDVDRTLMSAEANLAGLYPPIGRQIWDQNLMWQPIPIHTIPEKEDAVLAMKKKCPKYNRLFNDLMHSQYFRNISRKNHDLYAYLARNTGDPITTLETLEYLYNTLLIETFFNYTLPEWALKVFPEKLTPWAFLSFATACYTPELARLKAGPFFNEIIGLFQNKTSTTPDTRKFFVYSGHDTTIANLLNSMGVFEYHCPPYASTLIFELRQANNKSFVNIFYKNSTEPQNIVLNGCGFNCDLQRFIDLLKPITISLDQWEIECSSGWFNNWPLIATFVAVLMSIVGCICLLSCGLYVAFKCSGEQKDSSYIQLPNEEYA